MTELEQFDYGLLSGDVRAMIGEHTDEIRRLARRAAQDVVEIGERLLEVKSALEHGQFRAWLQAEFGWSKSTAQNFMQVAETFGGANVQNLDISASALYALAATSTPTHIREELLEESRVTGQRLTNKAVQARLQDHRAPAAPPEEAPAPAEVEPKEAPAPAEPADNGDMATKKKGKPVKAVEPYVPLPVEYEEREHEDGSVHLYPKLPTTQKQEEIKQKDWDAAARRVSSAAYSAKVALGQLQGFSLDELQAVVESQPGMQQGVAVQLKALRDRMTELMAHWEQLPTEARVVDAPPLFDLLPPKDGSHLN